MAATVSALGKLESAANTGSQVLTLTAGAAVGDLVVVSVTGNQSTTTHAISDSKGNTWASSAAQTTVLSARSQVFWSVLTTALVTGDTITDTRTGTAGSCSMTAARVQGVTGTTATVADQQAANAATAAALTVGPTATTAQASELVWAAFFATTGPITTGTGYTADPNGQALASLSGRLLQAEYAEVSAAGAQTATASDTSQAYQAILVTFKLAGGAPDTTPPQTTITSPTPGQIFTTGAVTVTATSSEGGSTFQLRRNGGAYVNMPGGSFSYGALADGSHTVDVIATDAAGNADPTPATVTFTVDTTAPDTTITAPASGATIASGATVSVTFTATEAATFQGSLDGATYATVTSPWSLGVLAAGSHTVAVKATDTAGNVDATPASVTFTVAAGADTTPPDTTISSPANGASIASGAAISVSFSATESSTFEGRVDGGGWGAVTSPWAVGVLSAGTHTLEVRATDLAGNVDATPALVSVTVAAAPLAALPPIVGASPRRPRLQVFIDGRRRRVDALSYSNVDPGGFEACQMTVESGPAPRAGAPIVITDGLETVWEGIVEEPGQRHHGTRAANVTGVGEGAALKRNPFRMVYLDRRIDRWQSASSRRQSDLIAQSYNVSAPAPAPDTAAPTLLFSCQAPWSSPTLVDCEALYQPPPGVTLAWLIVTFANVNLNATDSLWRAAAYLADDDRLTNAQSGSNMSPANMGASGTDGVNRRASKAAAINLYYTATGAGGTTNWVWQARPLVVGDHQVTLRGGGGTAGIDAYYLTTSDVAVDALRRGGADFDLDVVDAGAEFPVRQLTYDDRTTPEQVITDMARLAGWHWGVWERPSLGGRPRFVFAPRPSDPTCIVSFADLPGDLDLTEQLSTMANQAIVSYTNELGAPAEAIVNLPHPRIPDGITQQLLVSTGPAKAADAQALGLAELGAAQLHTRAAGSLPLPAFVRAGAGLRPSHHLKAGLDRIRVAGMPTDGSLLGPDVARGDTFRVRRVSVSVQAGQPRTTVEVDSGADLVEVLQAQLAAGAAAG